MKSIRNVIGPQVRRIRSAQEMTQDALAARLQRAGWDVSRTSLAKIEAQLRWVADCELYFLAVALGVSMEDLFPNEAAVKKFVGSPEFKRN
jgi:transcriptional regulator with XRE-family HTH domain